MALPSEVNGLDLHREALDLAVVWGSGKQVTAGDIVEAARQFNAFLEEAVDWGEEA